MRAFHISPARYAACQRCVMRLLEESPLPWTREMLRSWYGDAFHVNDALSVMLRFRRIWRCAPNLYTSVANYSHEAARTPVTDEALARYGFNL